MNLTRQLAHTAFVESKIKEGIERYAEPCKGASIDASAGALISWQGFEGVKIPKVRKPIRVIEVKDGVQVQKMYVMSKILNEKAHFFENMIVLN
jgi:hypothetical protein